MFCALIGEKIESETAANVVTIASNNNDRTSSLLLDDLQYQKAPSTATARIIGNAIASIIEICTPATESIPISATITRPTLPSVTAHNFQSRMIAYITATKKNAEGIRIDLRSSSAIFFDFWKSMFIPTPSISKSVFSLTFSAQRLRVFQSVTGAPLSDESSQIIHKISSESGGVSSDAPGNEGHAMPKLESFGSKSIVV